MRVLLDARDEHSAILCHIFFVGRLENNICDIFTRRNLCGCMEIINKSAKSFLRRAPGQTTTEFLYGIFLRSIVCLQSLARCCPVPQSFVCRVGYLRACASANILKCCLLSTCSRLSTLHSVVVDVVLQYCRTETSGNVSKIKNKYRFSLVHNAPSNF